MKTKLYAIAKDEAAYLPFWVQHHLHFGFDSVEVWLNRITDNSVDMMRELSRLDGRVTYSEVDPDQIVAGRKSTFQESAYRVMFEKARHEGFDYVMFLDLDEYWMPKDFSGSIADVISSNPLADCVSFQWYLDSPDTSRGAFERSLKPESLVSQNRHVKTLIRVSDRVERFKVHNAIVRDGRYILADGSPFVEDDAAGQVGRQLISVRDFSKQPDIVKDHFVLHSVFRSQVEYLASLLRGRPQKRKAAVSPIKDNRWGYVPEPSSHIAVRYSIDPLVLGDYYQRIDEVLSQGRIPELLAGARRSVLERCRAILSAIEQTPEVVDGVEHVLRGLTLPPIEEHFRRQGPLVTAHIDEVDMSAEACVVTGWAFASDYRDELYFELVHAGQSVRILNHEKVKRPDVAEAVDSRAPLHSGFRITFELQQALTGSEVLSIGEQGGGRFWSAALGPKMHERLAHEASL